MTCKPDIRLLASVLVLALAGGPVLAAPGSDAITEAIDALDRGDGVAAEIAGKRALEQGATREQVAAYVGEGELLQDDLRDAHDWLDDARFDAPSRKRGLHALARLNLRDGDLDAAQMAFDQLLAAGGGTALAWVDIGHLRYRMGNHLGALDAAREAMRLGPREPRALEFNAELLRDSEGLLAARTALGAAIDIAPEDMGLLAQYAATLGDAGENGAMLQVVRGMVDLNRSDPHAYFLQAVLAARAGDNNLARRLLWHTDGAFDETAAGLILNGALDYRSGNYGLAAEEFDRLARMQPLNVTARLLLARALLANGEANEVVALVEPLAQQPDASNYMLVLMARAQEQLGRRDLAAPYLDRANRMMGSKSGPLPGFVPSGRNSRVPAIGLRQMIAEGRIDDARASVSELRSRFPGSADVAMLAGDVELLAHAPERALAYYRDVAKVRTDWPLVRRMVSAQEMRGDSRAARETLAQFLLGNPRSGDAAALLGRMHREAGNPARATVLLRHASAIGSGSRDPLLLADLAELELHVGHSERAAENAEAAATLQRGNRKVAAALARVLAMSEGG